MMKNILLIALYVNIIIFGTLLSYTGCRVFDFLGKDSTTQTAAPYKPPARIETLEEEQPVVQARINELSEALIAKDVEKAVGLCTRKDRYREMFQKNKDELPNLGQALKKAKLTLVGPGYTSHGSRGGEVTVAVGSEAFSIFVVKYDGQWFFQDL